MRRSMMTLLLVGVFTVCLVDTACLGVDKFPAKPIELWVGFGAGGSSDLPSRFLSEAASKILGQPMVVINIPGGGSSVMLSQLKNAKPDGYTIGNLSTGGIISANLRKVPYHPVKDFDPILQYSVYTYGIVVRADSPWKTFQDLITYAKGNPGKIKYSTAGAGLPQHLAMLQLAEAAKIKWTHIPYSSGVDGVTALLGGHVDVAAQLSEAMVHIDAGRLRIILTFWDKRMEEYPNVPTPKEEGYSIYVPSIVAFIGPKGLPVDRVKILHDAFYKGMQDPGYKKVLQPFGMPVVYRNTKDCGKVIEEIYENSANIISRLEAK